MDAHCLHLLFPFPRLSHCVDRGCIFVSLAVPCVFSVMEKRHIKKTFFCFSSSSSDLLLLLHLCLLCHSYKCMLPVVRKRSVLSASFARRLTLCELISVTPQGTDCLYCLLTGSIDAGMSFTLSVPHTQPPLPDGQCM